MRSRKRSSEEQAGLRCAIYARYSADDKDRKEKHSIKAQIEACKKLAATHDWVVDEKHGIFIDEGISGTATGNRPGYLAMQEQIENYDCLLLEDLYRLARSSDLSRIVKRLRIRGLRILSCVEGFDSSARSANREAARAGMMGEDYAEYIGERVYSTLEMLAENGENAGGNKYGYTTRREFHPTKLDSNKRPLLVRKWLEVNPEETEVIVRAFELYASGLSRAQIAAIFNDEGIKSPGGKLWSSSNFDSNRKLGFGLFNNSLYNGVYTWNRTHGEKDPDTGKWKYHPNPRDEWIEVEREDLRIIDEKRWQAVKARQEAGSEAKNGAKIAATLAASAKQVGGRLPRYVLGGILRCKVCGAKLQADGKKDWLCPRYADGSCTNSLRVHRDLIDTPVAAALRSHLLSKEAIASAQKHLEAILKEREREERTAALPSAIAKSIREIEAKIENVRKLDLPAYAADPAISALQAQLTAIKEQAAGRATRQLVAARDLMRQLPRIMEKYIENVNAGFKALTGVESVAKARETVRSLLLDGRIELGPDAANRRWLGTLRFRSIGQFAIEAAGLQRNIGHLKASGRNGTGTMKPGLPLVAKDLG